MVKHYMGARDTRACTTEVNSPFVELDLEKPCMSMWHMHNEL